MISQRDIDLVKMRLMAHATNKKDEELAEAAFNLFIHSLGLAERFVVAVEKLAAKQ